MAEQRGTLVGPVFVICGPWSNPGAVFLSDRISLTTVRQSTIVET